MEHTLLMHVAATMLGALVAAPLPAGDARQKGAGEEVKKDIASHRAMAEAHTNAAACLEAGKTEKECHAQLQKDCKGVGIGKHCGMKHAH